MTKAQLKFLAANMDRFVAQGRVEHGQTWENAVNAEKDGGADYRAAADRGDKEIAFLSLSTSEMRAHVVHQIAEWKAAGFATPAQAEQIERRARIWAQRAGVSVKTALTTLSAEAR